MTADPSSPNGPPGGLLVLPFYDGPHVIAVLAGEADGSNADRLRDRLLECVTHGPRSLVVDARDLTFRDLQGIAALTDALDVVQRSGMTVTVRPSPQLTGLMATVDRGFRTTGRRDGDAAGRPRSGSARPTA